MSGVIDPDLDGKVAIIARGQKDTNDRFQHPADLSQTPA